MRHGQTIALASVMVMVLLTILVPFTGDADAVGEDGSLDESDTISVIVGAASVTVPKGTTVGGLTADVPEGYEFGGWFSDKLFTTALDDSVVLIDGQTVHPMLVKVYWRYTLSLYSTSNYALYLIRDLGDGTVLDGRWEAYRDLYKGNTDGYTDDQRSWFESNRTGFETYDALLKRNGSWIETLTHTYPDEGTYVTRITAINPVGYVPPATSDNPDPKAYDGSGNTDYTGFDGGLMAGITPDEYRDSDRTVTGAWDSAANALRIYGYPTVSFETNGGSAVAQITVENGDTYTAAERPADPTKDGRTFAGWFDDAELTRAYDWESPVTAPITVYAKWTVTVTVDGGEKVFDDGSKVSDVPEPVLGRELAFRGWYGNAECTGDAIAPETELRNGTALFSKRVPQVWSTVDGTEAAFDQGSKASDVPRPAEDADRNRMFVGWFSDAALNVPVPMDTVLTDGMVLFSKVVDSVTVEVDGKEMEFEKGTKVSGLPVPEKEGYGFKAWYAGEKDLAILIESPETTELVDGQRYWSEMEETGSFSILAVILAIVGLLLIVLGFLFSPYMIVFGLVPLAVGALGILGIIGL